jgi:hypothetical protein
MGKILLELNGTQPVQEAPLLLNGAYIFNITHAWLKTFKEFVSPKIFFELKNTFIRSLLTVFNEPTKTGEMLSTFYGCKLRL